MNKSRELAKNTAIITVGKLCTQFLSFLLLPLYTALLSTSEYGTIDLLMTYQQLIGYIVFFQIEQSLFRFLIEIRDNNKKMQAVISSCFAFAFFQIIVLGVALLIFGSITHYPFTGYLYFYVVAVIFSGLMLQVARGMGKNTVYAIGSFISAMLSILFNILFLVIFRFGIAGMLLSYILGNLMCGFFIFIYLKVYRYNRITEISKDKIKECLAYSIPLVPNALSWWVMSASDRTIVLLALGTASNGLLTVAHKFPSAYSIFFTAFNLSWTESATLHITDDDHEEFFASVIMRAYRLFATLAIGIIACIPFVFNILINKNYAMAYYQIPIYMLASVCQVILGLYSVIYVALKKTKEIAKTTVVSAIINVIVNVAFINLFGLYAASISTLIAFAVVAIWRYYDIKKYMHIPFDIKLLFSTMSVYVMVCVGYYTKNIIMEVIFIVIAVPYCFYINRDIIFLIIRNPKNIKQKLTNK